MRLPARFIFLDKPDQFPFPQGKREILIGRSPNQCDFVITGDPAISRVQARIRFEDGHYLLENLGQNVSEINDQPVTTQVLNDGDLIRLGRTSLKFEAGEPVEPAPLDTVTVESEKTSYFESPFLQDIGPQLILTDASGEIHSYTIETKVFRIGRDPDCEARIDDGSVSRHHLLIEKRDEHYFVKNLSEGYPLKVNGRVIGKEEGGEKRLYSGDRIHVGTYFLSFISHRPEDAAPEGQMQIITRMKGAGWAVWALAGALLVVVVSYVLYGYVYRPWRIQKDLDQIAQEVKGGAHEQARADALRILKEPLSPEAKKTALDLLTTATAAMTDRLLREGKLLPARQLITGYLESYGASEASRPIRNKRDEINLKAGREYESAKQYENALNAYAAIGEDSALFPEAKKGMRRIWLEFQQQRLKNQNLAQLMERAEKNFLAKQYLTPVNENAYSVYKAVLIMDPGNKTALQRIGQMKDFYRVNGEKQLHGGNLDRAITYFERYEVIDPDNADVQKKIATIKKQLEARKAPVAKTPSAKQKEIKSLLEKSGKNGAWIMKYLFEDKKGEKGDQQPWN